MFVAKLYLQVNLSSKEKNILRKVLVADIAIYDFFSTKLELDIMNFDQDLMEKSIQEMKTLSKSVADFCILEKTVDSWGMQQYKVR